MKRRSQIVFVTAEAATILARLASALALQSIAGRFLLSRGWLISHFWRQILSPFSQTPLSPEAPFAGI